MAAKWEGVDLGLLDIILSPATWKIRVKPRDRQRWKMDGHMLEDGWGGRESWERGIKHDALS